MIFKGDYKFYVDGKSVSINDVFELVNTDMTVSVEGLTVHYFSPKKEAKTEKLLREAEKHQKQNGGILEGVEFPFDNYVTAEQVKEVYKNMLYNFDKGLESAKKETEGQKHNEGKLPIDIMLTVQFPKAIQAICKATLFGHEKYKETDEDWLNYKRVNGGSTTYANAGQRHNFNKSGKDEQSGLPHIIHKCWNALAELELWIEENKYEL